MQDFNYIFSNAMELTIEVSCCKYPRKSVLLEEWESNMRSLIELVEQAHIGIKGIVTRGSQNGPRIANAKIFVRKLTQQEETFGYVKFYCNRCNNFCILMNNIFDLFNSP